MGRGRQKAKHTKVARDLKYYSPNTNYGALANELHSSGGVPAPVVQPVASPELDKWAEYLVDDDSDEDDEYETDESSTQNA
jgi:Protein of unknown function (DUF3073)